MKHAHRDRLGRRARRGRPRRRRAVTDTSAKIAPLDVVRERVAAARRAGRTVALANGCFDVLHVGHVRYLEGAAAEADVLVVGDQRRRVGAPAEGRGTAGPAGRRPRSARGGAARRRPRRRLRGGRRAGARSSRCAPTCTARAPTTPPDTVPERDIVRSYGGRVAIVGDPKDHDTRDADREDPRVKALVVRLSSIGDVVHTLPVLAALQRHGWEAGWLVEPPSRPLLEDNPMLRRGRGRAVAAERSRWGRAIGAVRALRRAPVRRRARLPGPVEVGGVGAPVRRPARRRLEPRLAPRAVLRGAPPRDRSAATTPATSSTRTSSSSARSASRPSARASSRCRTRSTRWLESTRGLRRRRRPDRGPQPRRRLGEQAVAGRALRRARQAAARARPRRRS